jgi:hypothetical protein
MKKGMCMTTRGLHSPYRLSCNLPRPCMYLIQACLQLLDLVRLSIWVAEGADEVQQQMCDLLLNGACGVKEDANS